jgi:hypothetical protein
MTGESLTTTDHNIIRTWTERRDGKPARVKDTERSGDDTGILRIAFDTDQEALEPITWDEFFDKFERENLAFLYQEQTRDGKTSRFFKFVNRD